MSEQEATLDEFTPETEEETGEQTSDRHLPEVGEIPDDWNLVTVEEISDNLLGGGTPSKSEEDYWDGDIPWASVKDLNGIELYETEDYITECGVENSATNIAPANSIIISTRMTVGEPFLNKVEMAINQDMKAIIPNKKRANPLFLVYSLWDKDPYLKSLGRGTTVDGITTKDLLLTHLGLPSLEEQRKIATVLYTVDRAIEKTEEIIEHLDILKSGVVQEVFSEGTLDHETYQTTKSGGVPEGWELAAFEEVITDTRYGTDTKSNTNSNGYPTLRIPNVVNKRITVDNLKHTPLDEDELERLELEDGDILVLRTNGNPNYVGRCATFHERDESFVFASYLIRVRVDESRVSPGYVREFLNSPRGRSEMAGWIRSSAGNYNLSVGAMEKFQMPIPSLEEQDEIVEKITEVEKAIETNRNYRDNLQRLKRGLMQDLLSGTVRTTDTNIQVPDDVLQHG